MTNARRKSSLTSGVLRCQPGHNAPMLTRTPHVCSDTHVARFTQCEVHRRCGVQRSDLGGKLIHKPATADLPRRGCPLVERNETSQEATLAA